MIENKSGIKRKLLRIAIGAGLMCVSLIIGVVAGVKISINNNDSSDGTVIDSDNTPLTTQLVNFLKDNWYSDIYYGKEIDENVLIHQFVGALSTSEEVLLDPYTYLIKKEQGGAVAPKTGKLGITVNYHYNYPVVTEISEGAAAEGYLAIGDIITAAGRRKGNDWEYHSILDEGYDFSNLLSSVIGLPGEDVFVEVARFDENNKLNFVSYVIKLKEAKPYTWYSYLLEEDIDDTIMVKMTSFIDSGNDDEEISEADFDDTCYQLDYLLENNKANNLILDLRDNGGGALSSVVRICDLFLQKDQLITTLQDKNGRKTEYRSQDDKMYEFDNICILQNENTASASEVLISTLLHYFPEKVTLIGSKSYGKGIAQYTTSVLNNQYYLQYTCAKWLRPDGSWIGMTDSAHTEGYQLGFDPSENCNITRSNLLYLMEGYNQGIYYKENSSSYLGFAIDQVSVINKYFFILYNQMFNDNVRIDTYFDESCSNAIKKYQALKGIEQTGVMNEETFLYFVQELIIKRNEFK